MAQRISRRILTEHVADRLIAGDDQILRQLAAYLIDIHRTKEADLYVRDIEAALAQKGVVIADVIAARDLAQETKGMIARYLQESYQADTVELRQQIDADLIGGVQVRTADAEYDASVRRKLTELQKMKV